MTWTIRRSNPESFNDYVLMRGAHVVTMSHYDKAGATCEEYECKYDDEGASVYYMDLPRKGFESLYSDVESSLKAANKSWKFVLSGLEQQVSFGSIVANNCLPVHTDHDADNGSKLSLLQLMNDDYEGGELFIGQSLIEWSSGDVVVFPSFMPMSIENVIAGECIVFAAWATGPRFR